MNPRISAILLCILTAHAEADETTTKSAEVRFLAQSAPAKLGKVAIAVEETLTEAFDLPVNNLSMPLKSPARTFKLWAVEKSVSLTTITLPEQGDAFIALLIPSPESGYKSVIIPDKQPSFRGGDIYFYNHADKPVLGYVGKSKFLLHPSQGTIVRPTGAREGKFYDVGLGVREPEGDRTLATTRWPEDKQIRNYVFFFVHPTSKRISYRAVDDFIATRSP